MPLNDYLNDKFPNMKLRPPLFYNWDFGIRFELGNPDEENVGSYMERVYFRAISLFKELHSTADEILIITNVLHAGEENILRRPRIKLLNKYIKRKEVLYKLQHQVIPYVFEDIYDIFDFETHRYMLKCKVSDVSAFH